MVRGDVHSITLPKGRGRVQRGRRFAVIVQTDDLLALSTVVICPTSASVPPASFHPEIELDGDRTRVLCEMVGAVDALNLGD
ncbi:MAG: type II toxin-antitoxin system PemK/MazF family toxin, partial [Solirubrobacteraceae bacterium]